MNKGEFNDKLADFLSSLKNYRQTDNKRALELYVGYLKETEGKTPMTKYLAENGKNPHGPLFGYREAKNAMNTGRYLFEKLRNVIEPKYIFTFIDDWRAEPTLFPTEETAAPEQTSTEKLDKIRAKGLGPVEHMAETMTVISAKMNDIIDMLDTIIKKMGAAV